MLLGSMTTFHIQIDIYLCRVTSIHYPSIHPLFVAYPLVPISSSHRAKGEVHLAQVASASQVKSDSYLIIVL